ncbi:Arabinose operon regulatory protein [Poriferisphaera corsica]|uniref:Arabinose operon regulatory protein n=1 Tax=Poriferisphaera corsica TaxID=2528020 RepID=A0A517YR98_9BACT|nr:AraC family transcriptional regulator [Poriferisphaera corsica]QDU32746.1 Arabinose operon regulatory protein [Poriferisphaera corsica]
MLGYIGLGTRHYGDYPTQPVTRALWEFQAVVEGYAAPLLPENMNPDLKSHTMWVFAPHQLHGWTGLPNTGCRVFVAQFDQVPDALRHHVTDNGPLCAPLGPEQSQALYQSIREVVPDYEYPTGLSNMRFDKLLLELSLSALKDVPMTASITPEKESHRKVAHALSWYAENLASNPSVEIVAAAVRISPSHLRRLFNQVESQSPIAMFKQIQIGRAKELMSQTNLPLRDVARACGFSEQSIFSRCFKQQTTLTPRNWKALHRKDETIEGPGIIEDK